MMKRAVFCSFLFNREKCYARRDGEFWHIFAKKCQEGRGILAHICQKVNKRSKMPGGTGNFGKYLPKSEQKEQNNAKKPLAKNLSPSALTCSIV